MRVAHGLQTIHGPYHAEYVNGHQRCFVVAETAAKVLKQRHLQAYQPETGWERSLLGSAATLLLGAFISWQFIEFHTT